MKPARGRPVLTAVAVLFGVSAWGDAVVVSPIEAARAAATAAVEAAVDVAEGDAAGAVARLGAAETLVLGVSTTTASERRALVRVTKRLHAAGVLAGGGSAKAIRALRGAASAAHDAVRRFRTDADGFDVVGRRGDGGFRRAGARVTLRAVGCDEAPVVEIENASPGSRQRTFAPGAEILADGSVRVTLGPDLGGVRVTMTACGATREYLLFDQGPRGAFAASAPQLGPYGGGAVSLRVGVPRTLSPQTAAHIDTFEIVPPLPSGLAFDTATGALSGTPATAVHRGDYTVIGRNRRGSAATTVSLEVTPALPDDVVSLEDGFIAEPVARGLDVPVKMAFAPDGRLFFNELVPGNVRVMRDDGSLVAAPFATIPILTGGERGLTGIALAPDFDSTGHVFVFASTAADGVLPDRSRVLRLTADGNAGADLTVIVDSLPISDGQNGGALAFGPDGKLYVTVGDTTNPELAQTDGSRAGRILRFNADGTIPADNPIPGDPEWCRGLRNCFDLAFEPTTGSLFASENGPTAHDELDFVQRGKNYEWGAEPESLPGPLVGLRMVDWTPVIVPTGITFLARGGFGSQYGTSLFVAGYDQSDLRRIVLSGANFTDVDEERPFARWKDEGLAQKPLDLAEAPDGSLYVSTFTAIWRISRY